MSRSTAPRRPATARARHCTGQSPSSIASLPGKLRLICPNCSTPDQYQVGKVFIAPEFTEAPVGDLQDRYVSFTRLFHCRHCGAGGPWELPPGSRRRVVALLILSRLNGDQNGVFVGELRTFDGRRFRCTTETEAYLKSLIEKEPCRAFLWVRLGNLYMHADRPELAKAPYRRALQLDPQDIEAHAMMAEYLEGQEREQEALAHLENVLRHARLATHVKQDMRHHLVSTALARLLDAKGPNEVFRLLPRLDEEALAKRPKDEPLILHLREWDLSDPDDWDDLCSLFLGKPLRGSFDGGRRKRRTVGSSPARTDRSASVPDGAAHIGRNAPCVCGSGRKYKKCCGARQTVGSRR